MNIIITMAGCGKRFKQAGYIQPKYMIVANGYSLFEWAMISLAGFNGKNIKYIFIVKKQDNALNFIGNKCNKLGIDDFFIKEIDFVTDGQAETAVLAKDLCDMEKPVLIYNIDTFVIPYSLKISDIKGAGFIPCSFMQGENWSFVKTGKNNKAVEVSEKKRISDNCSIGLYCFSSYKLFCNLYKEFYLSKTDNSVNEKYIAPMYNLLIEKNMDVYISNIKMENVFVLGTPEELEIFKKQKIQWMGKNEKRYV